MLSAEVGLQDSLGAVGVTLLRIERRSGHVRNHGVSTAKVVLGVAENVVLGGGLDVPDVTSVAAKVAGLESCGNVFLDNNGSTSGVDEPRSYYLLD